MSGIMMSTKEVAHYLGIHEKQVYALIKERKIPCTRVTGKWIFPKDLIDEWIHTTSMVQGGSLLKTPHRRENLILASGSNDPILDILLNDMKAAQPELYIFSCSTGSMEGLRLLSEGKSHIAWCHLLDPESGGYNIPFVSSCLGGQQTAIVHLFYRQIGFVSRPDSRFAVTKFTELSDSGLSFINRQKGSGTRVLLDYHLKNNNVNPDDVCGYDKEVYTHFEVGLSILSGEADVGIATVAVANLLGLRFSQIVNETFDMVLHQETFFSRAVQVFIETLKSERFREKVKPLGHYDFRESGKIIYSSE